MAALYNRHDQPAAAESIYAGLLKNAPGSLAYIAWPTPAQLSLAMAGTLSIQGRKKAVQEVLTRGLSFIDPGSQKNGFVRRESYLQSSMQLLQNLGLSPTMELNEALQKLEARKPIQLAVKHVRDVSLPREMAARGDLSSPRWSWRGIRSKVGVAWKPTPAVIDTAGIKGAGMIVNVERLLSDLNSELLRLGESGSRQVVLLDPARKDSMITYASLDGNFGFFSIGQTKEEWEKRLGAARRPFAIAGLLSGILGLTLVGGLLVLRKAMRKEMNLSRMKTEFVANVSHELKTPLSLIKLCSETLQFDRVQGEEKRQEYFEVINRESDRLGHLIGNVLNFSRIDAGKKNYDLKKTDLAPVLNQTLDAYFLQIKEQDFSCARNIPASLPAVLADEEAVAQAFINLLQNAVRYSPEKGDLTVRGWSDGRFLLVSIADKGIGIAEEEQQRIWDDYYRTAEARALGTRGSGLGLSLV
ncbi:MAG: HAMP domain-containing histidine kinase, partial [Planctomycetes bacterium]|nr:HAMP domain-containing histidine kinase [Planctomycetota bacterium]